jgi:hypothetical protein
LPRLNSKLNLLLHTLITDDVEEEDYDPEGNDNEEEEEDPEIEDGDEEDDDDDEPGPSTAAGRKKKQSSKAPPPKKNAAKRAALVRAQQQTIDDDGPIAVTRAEMQQAENSIINYSNSAEQLRQEAANRGGGPTRQGIDALVRLVVRHVIFSNTEKPGVPIPRNELTKLVADNSATFSKRAGLPSLIITIAQAKLAECFGMELVELTKSRVSAKDRAAGTQPTATQGQAGGADGPKQLVLRSIVPPSLYAAAVAKRNAAASNAFLAVIMSIIQMAGGSVTDDELWKHLGNLAVEKAEEHPQLGLPHDLMEEFIKKRQINVERIAGAEGPELFYSIAENAANEVEDEALASFYEAEFA